MLEDGLCHFLLFPRGKVVNFLTSLEENEAGYALQQNKQYSSMSRAAAKERQIIIHTPLAFKCAITLSTHCGCSTNTASNDEYKCIDDITI